MTISPRPWFHSSLRLCSNDTSVLTYVPASSHTVGSGRSKYGCSSTSSPSGARLAGREQDGVALAHEEAAARAQQAGDDAGPAVDVGQPDDARRCRCRRGRRPPPGGRRGRRTARTPRSRRRRRPPRRAAGPRSSAGRREVETGHAGAEAGERHRVGADVALQVDAAHALAGPEPRAVEGDHVADVVGIGGEAGDAVVGRAGVGRRPLVPHRPVDRDVALALGHRRTLARRGSRAVRGYPRPPCTSCRRCSSRTSSCARRRARPRAST